MYKRKEIVPRESYPPPKLKYRGGFWHCKVHVPTPLWYLYSRNASVSRTLNTTSEAVADRKLIHKAQEIYDEFDRKQIEYREKEQTEFEKIERKLDENARRHIINFAEAFSVKIPDLDNTTPLPDLQKAKVNLDVRRDMVAEVLPAKSSDGKATPEQHRFMQQIVDVSSPEKKEGKFVLDTGFTVNHHRMQMRYRSMAVTTFWQDLFINAANAQGLEAPQIEDPEPLNMFFATDEMIDDFSKLVASQTLLQMQEDGKEIDIEKDMARISQDIKDVLKDVDTGYRPRQTKDPKPNQITKFLTEWDLRVDRNYDKINTRRKLKKAIRQFVDLVGDLIIDQVKPFHVFEYIDALLGEDPDMARSTLNDKVWQCSSFFKMIMEKNLGITANPFVGIDLANRGKATVSWQRYTNDELHKIFAYDWPEDQRILLAILITTGMRLNEATQLSWERFNDTEYQGIPYFTLLSVVTDEGLEETDVKTSGSERYIIVHPDLLEILLPLRKKTGKVFAFSENYTERQVNSTLAEIVDHPKKRIHSFRRTFKILYRDNLIDEKTIDALVGHAEGDASRRAYAGVSVPTRHEHLRKVRHPWLKAKPTTA